MFHINSKGAEEMLDLTNLVDRVIGPNKEAKDQIIKDNIQRQRRVRLGAPPLGRAGTREPKI